MYTLSAVILDRDGTLIIDKHYLSKVEDVELFPGAAGAMKLLGEDMRFFVITNQSGIARGYVDEKTVRECNKRMKRLLEVHEVELEGTTYCPHLPEDNCQCRKPATGLWDNLRIFAGLDPEETAMIGDKTSDVEFGHNAGLFATVLVETGKGADTAKELGLSPAPELPGFTIYPEPASTKHPHILARNLHGAMRGLKAFVKLLNEKEEDAQGAGEGLG